MIQFSLLKRRTNSNPNIPYPPTKKVFLFTNARNEKHIKEWAFHHLLIGFDRVFIFDHKSQPPIVPFSHNVQVIRCDIPNPVKIYLMNEALKIAKMHKADWFIYLDADEFIVLNNFKDIKQMLNHYHHAHSLSLNWLMFGTNFHEKEPKGLILENYTKCENKLNPHVKTFVRPNAVIQSINPHYYSMKNPSKLFNLKNQLMNVNSLAMNPINCNFSEVSAYIAHYIYQSKETYINRKIKLPTDDTGIIRSLDKNIHQQYNDIENSDPKEKYVKRLKILLKC
jgi:hypothetical protein